MPADTAGLPLFGAPSRPVCRCWGMGPVVLFCGFATRPPAGENVDTSAGRLKCHAGHQAPDSRTIDPVSDSNPTTRLDKWLWASRFYKTRQLAAEAVKGGHVEVNGARAKPARGIRIGDRVSVRKAPFDFDITVLELRERRVSAKEAQSMYEESQDSIDKREKLRLTLRSQSQQILYDTNKPDKRDRRQARERKRGG
jgi:ribosome-associated heat shock protein Hsp15